MLVDAVATRSSQLLTGLGQTLKIGREPNGYLDPKSFQSDVSERRRRLNFHSLVDAG